jgi:hypothetical protein
MKARTANLSKDKSLLIRVAEVDRVHARRSARPLRRPISASQAKIRARSKIYGGGVSKI